MATQVAIDRTALAGRVGGSHDYLCYADTLSSRVACRKSSRAAWHQRGPAWSTGVPFGESIFGEYPQTYQVVGDAPVEEARRPITAYQVVVSKYPNSEQVPEAYLKQGQSYQQLKQNAQAVQFYNLVIKRFPKSDAALFAQEYLKGIK